MMHTVSCVYFYLLVQCIQRKLYIMQGGHLFMKTEKHFYTAICQLIVFTFWTILVYFVDIQPIGPQGSKVGFAAFNRYVHELTGVHFFLYDITDWLGLVPIGIAAGFALLGLTQWIQRRKLLRVDRDLLLLGCFYIVVIAAFLFFEIFVINYRPVLIEGKLEASYPSSTTMLALCVMPTAIHQISIRIKNRQWKMLILNALHIFTVFMVIGRLISGVHWATDIIGGILLSAGLVKLYLAANQHI